MIVNGTAGDDAIVVTGSARLKVTGLPASVAIAAAEQPTTAVNALGGDDTSRRPALEADAIKQLTVDGEGGDDLLGGHGADELIGGDGDDFIDGNQANDVAFMGAGDDTFRWDPGDGSDAVEGEDGSDTLLFNGANAAEPSTSRPTASRFTFFRQPGNITMDVNGVETSPVQLTGRPDQITVNDLTGTDVAACRSTSTSRTRGARATATADRVIVNGTAGDDSNRRHRAALASSKSGLSPRRRDHQPEFANDRVDINTGAWHTRSNTSGLEAGVIQLFVDGVLVP